MHMELKYSKIKQGLMQHPISRLLPPRQNHPSPAAFPPRSAAPLIRPPGPNAVKRRVGPDGGLVSKAAGRRLGQQRRPPPFPARQARWKACKPPLSIPSRFRVVRNEFPTPSWREILSGRSRWLHVSENRV
ncbi:uncharacterized protein VTP21DRAFT_9221 [Calcarisporiella thermophila]|uniref:uncharacterized protein n=1 Tax=Calcarisporiella thermophila TaxID=911321 RepID=UPI00374377C6